MRMARAQSHLIGLTKNINLVLTESLKDLLGSISTHESQLSHNIPGNLLYGVKSQHKKLNHSLYL